MPGGLSLLGLARCPDYALLPSLSQAVLGVLGRGGAMPAAKQAAESAAQHEEVGECDDVFDKPELCSTVGNRQQSRRENRCGKQGGARAEIAFHHGSLGSHFGGLFPPYPPLYCLCCCPPPPTQERMEEEGEGPIEVDEFGRSLNLGRRREVVERG